MPRTSRSSPIRPRTTDRTIPPVVLPPLPVPLVAGVGVVVGEGLGLGEGLGDGDGEGLGDGDGEGLGDGVGVGVGLGDGAVVGLGVGLGDGDGEGWVVGVLVGAAWNWLAAKAAGGVVNCGRASQPEASRHKRQQANKKIIRENFCGTIIPLVAQYM